MEKLLPYFERELSMLRRTGAEFASRYPRLAGSLQISGETCTDPHVERLIQASALLNARVAKLLDDGYGRFTEALLGMLYPHYLRPMPSCSIARIDYSGAKPNELSNVITVPRGTAMKALARAAIACRFRTTCDVVVAPVAISAVQFEPCIQVPATLPIPPAAGSAIRIAIDCTASGRKLAALGLSTLRVFIDGEASLRAALRDALFMRAAAACVEADGQWRMLDTLPIKPAGFADDEALFLTAPSEYSAYRLLSEFFTLPEKFDFFDIDLQALLAVSPPDCTRLVLRLALAELRPDAPVARLLRSLSSDNLVLGCTPVINLFAQAAVPIRVNHRHSSYPLTPDAMPGDACEIYSVDTVQLVRKSPQGSSVTDVFPYYSLRHGEESSRKGHYWLVQRDEALASAAAGQEFSLTLVDRDFSPLQLEDATASVRLTCTNRNLPLELPHGRPGGDLSTEVSAGNFPIRLLRRPTRSYRPAHGSSTQWGLITHLALNHRSLTADGLPTLAAMLRLYTQQDSVVSQKQIDGIKALSHHPATTWVRQAHGNAYLCGVRIHVSLDEEAYTGTGIHVFAQMLDHLFGLQVHLNSFTQLLVFSHMNGKELMRCPPRNGTLTLA